MTSATKPGLTSVSKKVVFLTGTPIENRPIEFQPLLTACAPEEFTFWGYARRYCGAFQESVPARGGRKLVWNFQGASNLEELQARVRATVMVRRLKTDVLTELPAKVRQIVHLAQNGAAKAIADENKAFAGREDAIDTLRAEVELAQAVGNEEAYKSAVASLEDALSVAFSEMSAKRHETALAKAPYVVSYLRDMIDAGVKKVIVFAHHHDVIDLIASEFGSEAVVLTGRNSADQKQVSVDRFQNDPSVKVFVGQIVAAGVGITLTAASEVVFAELDWVPGKVSQAEDRANRIGQTVSVHVVHLVFDGSLDARMAKMLVEKQEIADRALDSGDKDFGTMAAAAGAAEAKLLADYNDLRAKMEAKGVKVHHASRYPVATAEERTYAKAAMQALAGVCDGAAKEDGMGFNKVDTRIGHSLAQVANDFTDGQVHLAKKLARTYRRQLSTEIVRVLGVGAKA